MKTELKPGKYVIAVSGGVDSVVLLDLLVQKYGSPVASRQSPDKSRDQRPGTSDHVQLVVAHYDHGIRPDSAKDREFVEQIAKQYGLEFYCAEGRLGPKASEELARTKRYEFLREVKAKTKSDATITAHHQDDLIETAIINVIRGTGRKGLSALKSTDEIKRPLLACGKQELIAYARKNKLKWRDDPSNLDQKYLRNYVRHSIVAKMNSEQKAKLLEALNDTKELNKEIDSMLGDLAGKIFEEESIRKTGFNATSHDLAKELLAHWLRAKQITFDSRMLERLVVFIKTAKKGAKADINKNLYLYADKDCISLRRNQPV